MTYSGQEATSRRRLLPAFLEIVCIGVWCFGGSGGFVGSVRRSAGGSIDLPLLTELLVESLPSPVTLAEAAVESFFLTGFLVD